MAGTVTLSGRFEQWKSRFEQTNAQATARLVVAEVGVALVVTLYPGVAREDIAAGMAALELPPAQRLRGERAQPAPRSSGTGPQR